ncbi:MAG: AAA family ATPase [Candidatus Nanopelagicales bacterium]
MDDLRSTMDPVIFLEKVRRPVLRGLVRERLDRQLAELGRADLDCTCVLALAPPGSGKTTLLSQLAEASGLSTAWYRAGAEDADEVALTRHLGYALGSATGDPRIVESAASGRIADLLRRLDLPQPERLLLVIDDIHELAGTSAEVALEAFLRLRPRTITIALGSRRQPGMNTSRLLVSGELIMVDGEDLRFRSWEVERLFRSVYDAPLSPEAAAALTRRTGGWAAGLQLFHLATARLGRTERERAVADLSDRSRLIRSYLARNVLDGLPDDRRHFLLHTSALGVLTGDLCDELLETAGSAAVLAELEREQFFTTSSDGGLTYHYHQVLQTHLEILLADDLGGRGARDVYARSGRLLEQAGRLVEAVRAHARAEDWGAVARLMRPGTAVVDGDDTLWRMLSLPGAPTDDPGLVLAGARRLARDGQVESALAAYRQAEQLLDDPGLGRRCAAERRAVGVWRPLSVASVLPPAPTGQDPESLLLWVSIELRRLTRDVRRPESYDRGWLRGLAHILAGDLTSAARELTQPTTRIAAVPGWQPLAAELVGCIAQAIVAVDEALVGQIETIVLAADMDGWPWLARLGRTLQTVLQLCTGPAGWRVDAAVDLLAALERGHDRWSQLVAAVGIAVTAPGVGAHALAGEAREQARALAADLGAPALGAAIERLSGVPVWNSRPPPGPVSRPAAPGSVNLRCLGSFGLRVGESEVDWRGLRPRARSLLMILALHHGHALHRELIIEALWPEAPLASGIRSLQVAVSSARQCLVAGGLPGDPIRRQGDAYELVLPGVRYDVAEFERGATERRLTGRDGLQRRKAALDCYQGELLPEVGPADWVLEERDRLRLLAARVAVAAAADAVALDDLSVAIDLARHSIALDACHDPAWRLLIEAYERLGDLSAAAVARADHRRVWDDLGLGASADAQR